MNSARPFVVHNQETTKQCPKCQCRESYRLNDGRHMCRRCRTKYTPAYQLGRLDKGLVFDLANHFWLMTPIDATAELLEINRKTVQRYFGIIRKCIAGYCETQAARAHKGRKLDAFLVGDWLLPQSGSERRDTMTVFGLLADGRLVHLVFFRSWHDWSGMDLSSLRVQSQLNAAKHADAPWSHSDSAHEFWAFARERLRSYRGGFMKRFPTYIREMEFRYNYRQDPDAVWQIMSLLRSGPA